MFCCIVVSLSAAELNLFHPQWRLLGLSKSIKQQSFVNTATLTSTGSLGTAGKLCLDFVYMRRTRSAVGLILRQNSGDYSGAGQNTAALSEIAEVFFFRIVGLSARIRRTNGQSPLFCTNKDGQ